MILDRYNNYLSLFEYTLVICPFQQCYIGVNVSKLLYFLVYCCCDQCYFSCRCILKYNIQFFTTRMITSNNQQLHIFQPKKNGKKLVCFLCPGKNGFYCCHEIIN